MSFGSEGMCGVVCILEACVAMCWGSRELHMRHVIDRKASLPKNNCFLAFPMYWPCLSFEIHVF